MAIPSVASLFDPFLRQLKESNECRMSEISNKLATSFALSEEELKQLLPSGKDLVFANRLGWVRTYLKKAGLIEYVSWGVFRITEAGRKTLDQLQESQLTLQFLKQFPSFMEFYSPSAPLTDVQFTSKPVLAEEGNIDPEGSIEAGFALIRSQVEVDLLSKVKSVSPESFEELVVKLILGMGYGGSQQDAGRAIGRTGDGGIDGVIQEDRLGLDRIYLQAKRWEGVIGRPIVQAFVGALHGKHAVRGVLITTSSFTRDAMEYATAISDRVILVDGAKLVDLMFEFNIGVRIKETYTLKIIDPSFFEDLT